MKKKPLTDAERQRRRRQRLKEAAEGAKYSPEGFIAEAVRDLALSGEIPKALLIRICEKSTWIAKQQYPDLSIVLRKYLEKQINDFFNPKED